MKQTLLGLQFDTNPYLKGIQLVLDFKKYELSIVQHAGSYGGNKGLFEIFFYILFMTLQPVARK